MWLGTAIHRLCADSDYLVTVLPTTAGMRTDELVAAVTAPLDLIVAAGGDGTIRFVLGAVAQTGSQAPVGIIPLGTGNQLARNLGLYDENILADPLEDALKAILYGRPMRIDLGLMNGHYFAVAAGAGPMSDAVIIPGRDEKTNWKMLAYASSMIQTFALPPVVFKVTTGDDSFNVSASGIFATNVADMGVGTLSDSAELNDGLLDLCILNPQEFTDYLELGFRFAGGFVGGKAPYYIRKVDCVDIEVVPVRSPLSQLQRLGHRVRSFLSGKARALPPRHKEVIAMIDGDRCGTTPMHIEVVPQAVTILVTGDRERSSQFSDEPD